MLGVMVTDNMIDLDPLTSALLHLMKPMSRTVRWYLAIGMARRKLDLANTQAEHLRLLQMGCEGATSYLVALWMVYCSPEDAKSLSMVLTSMRSETDRYPGETSTLTRACSLICQTCCSVGFGDLVKICSAASRRCRKIGGSVRTWPFCLCEGRCVTISCHKVSCL